MGGSDWVEVPSLSNAAQTIVLLGRTGNGKSATGNSIIGKKAFKSKASSCGVTSSSELQSTKLHGNVVNVIDTPGLFDASVGPEFIGKEIVKCIDLAKDGLHAIVVVYSVRGRFSKEEEEVLHSLQTFFGPKIIDYMIVVFTGGDELEDNDENLEDYLGQCPKQLKNILEVCKNRCVLFDNKTKDEAKKAQQLNQLLSLVDEVIQENGGRPYTDDIYKELQKGALQLRKEKENIDSLQGHTKREISELKDQMHRSHEEQLKRITEMVELKLRDTTKRLEEQLEEEQAARLKAEKFTQVTQQKSNDEIRELRENLERAQRENEEFRKQLEGGKCVIL